MQTFMLKVFLCIFSHFCYESFLKQLDWLTDAIDWHSYVSAIALTLHNIKSPNLDSETNWSVFTKGQQKAAAQLSVCSWLAAFGVSADQGFSSHSFVPQLFQASFARSLRDGELWEGKWNMAMGSGTIGKTSFVVLVLDENAKKHFQEYCFWILDILQLFNLAATILV